jgi:hypothetical protein
VTETHCAFRENKWRRKGFSAPGTSNNKGRSKQKTVKVNKLVATFHLPKKIAKFLKAKQK